MKKVLKILCVVLVISLGVSLAACGKTKSEKHISRIEETQSTSNTAGSALTTETQNETFSEDERDYDIPETTETHYNHSAIQGCVIVEQDGTPMLQYSEKCESCGYVGAGKQTIYHYMDSYTTSFLCPQCSNTQMVEISTNAY